MDAECCQFCGERVIRSRGHWIAPVPGSEHMTRDGQDYGRARTCDASPVMAKLHAPAGPS